MRIGRVVDLSLALDADTQVYPGDPEVRLTPHSTIAEHGFNLLSVAMGSQSGTNVDAPLHFRDGAAPIDQVDLRLCVGRGVLMDVRGLPPRTAIREGHLLLDAVGPGDIAVLHTGWTTEHHGRSTFFDHPFLSADACQALLDLGVRTFALDAINIDETPDDDHPGVGFPVHHLIAAAGGVIVENLTNLDLVDWPDPLLSLAPLKLTGADGGPTRALAIEVLGLRATQG